MRKGVIHFVLYACGGRWLILGIRRVLGATHYECMHAVKIWQILCCFVAWKGCRRTSWTFWNSFAILIDNKRHSLMIVFDHQSFLNPKVSLLDTKWPPSLHITLVQVSDVTNCACINASSIHKGSFLPLSTYIKTDKIWARTEVEHPFKSY